MKLKSRPIPLLFKQSPIKSFRMWKEALNHLTPIDHAEAKKSGHFWATLGSLAAGSSVVMMTDYSKGLLSSISNISFGIIVLAFGYIQYSSWREERQKIKGLEEMKKSMEDENGNSVYT